MKVPSKRINSNKKTKYTISIDQVSLSKEPPQIEIEPFLLPEPRDYPISIINRYYLFYIFKLYKHKALKHHTEDIHYIRYFTEAQHIQVGF
ncbi:unnamed protein product [Penicillium salamii]|uniref:Uncharacterized protein n=1 Tax=Penicillium salamii TaxID=1612424 RepID=A0A9W4JXF1_9EURO|nr:unnamed protein product [Penicillium salamii]CAG7950489.1 unnamed protein product [Penicillium salamii]CAG7975851.1 unnamed protein product [Penicillium salamii]CAG8194952.1 unnamed protein product [Penicillium salamii]CAG8213753.1 unnamed protein product [Penicillium salamii]